MREVPLRLVVDDVLQRNRERFVTKLHLKCLVGIGREAVEEFRFDRRRLLADDAGQGGALGAVTFAGRAEAAEEMHFDASGFRELIRRQLCAALVEVIGDAHRPDGVGARWARPHFVELVERRHHRSLRLLDDVEVRREWRSRLQWRNRWRRQRGVGGRRTWRPAGDHGHRAHEGAAHHEGPPVHACGGVGGVELAFGQDRPIFAILLELHIGLSRGARGLCRRVSLSRATPVPPAVPHVRSGSRLTSKAFPGTRATRPGPPRGGPP
jgi:hypothetical protein